MPQLSFACCSCHDECVAVRLSATKTGSRSLKKGAAHPRVCKHSSQRACTGTKETSSCTHLHSMLSSVQHTQGVELLLLQGINFLLGLLSGYLICRRIRSRRWIEWHNVGWLGARRGQREKARPKRRIICALLMHARFGLRAACGRKGDKHMK